MPSEGGFSGALAFGDVVLVPFPFTDQIASKQRPAVVISTHGYNSARPDIILMAITSQLRAGSGVGGAYGEVWLADWHTAGLLKPSAVKPVIATLEAPLVIRQLGTLTDADALALRTALDAIIGDRNMSPG
jgi:mRNA interferase MazF